MSGNKEEYTNFNTLHQIFPIKSNLNQINSSLKYHHYDTEPLIENINSTSNLAFLNINFCIKEEIDNYPLIIPQKNPKLQSALDCCFSSNSTEGSEPTSNLSNKKRNIIKSNNFKEDKNRNYMDIDRAKRFWSKREDTILLNYIREHNTKNWKNISDYIKTKSPQQCAYRYGKLMSDLNKKKWTRKDDIKLLDLVESYGSDWQTISQYFNDRNERDVEFRYKERLDPNINKNEFTEEEDNLILKLHEEYGNQWFEISKYFQSRNSKMIKKRYQCFLRQNQKIKPKVKNNIQKSGSSNIVNNSKSDIMSSFHHSVINNSNHIEKSIIYKDKSLTPENEIDCIEEKNNVKVVSVETNNEALNNKEFLSIIYSNENSLNLFNLDEEDKNDSFNVDMFFDCSFNQNNLTDNLPLRNSVNEIEFSLPKPTQVNESSLVYSQQYEKLDKYFTQLTNSYRSKSRELESIIKNIRKKGLDTHEINTINNSLDTKVEQLSEQIDSIKEEKLGKNIINKNSIIKYIEIIILFIQQMKGKINLAESIENIAKFWH